jgi:hypothetical protein
MDSPAFAGVHGADSMTNTTDNRRQPEVVTIDKSNKNRQSIPPTTDCPTPGSNFALYALYCPTHRMQHSEE